MPLIADRNADAEPDFDTVKLVLAGPVGAGKSTALRSLADSEPVSTEMPLLDGPMGDKTTTTVALDFATVWLADETPLFVYGLPGQEHFAFMRHIVLEGAFGVVLVLNAADDDCAEQCAEWLTSLREITPDVGIVIGLTHADQAPDFSMGTIRQLLRARGERLPVFTFDAREREETTQLVRALLVGLAA